MSEVLISRQAAEILPSDLIRELGLQMSNHVMESHGQLLQVNIIREHLACCEAVGRRSEVEQFVQNFSDELTNEMRREFAISVHPVQIGSKLWLIDELCRHCDLSNSSLIILGAWYGILPLIINWRLANPPDQMVCIDSDHTVCEAGARMIGSLYANVEYRCADAMELDYSILDTRCPQVVINTICEHLPDLAGWWARIPHGQLVVLQSNNYTKCSDHVNCVHSTEQFRRQCPLSELLFEGTLHFSELDRFMLIGRR